MIRTLVTGATGTLGQALLPRLVEAGHMIRAASRSPPDRSNQEWVTMDLVTGEGINNAVEDIDVVVHAASAARGNSEAVDLSGTKRLLEAAAAGSVSNFLYISIVGVDEIPLSYYQQKLAAERAVEASTVPTTIVRATQFHSFLDEILRTVVRFPIWLLPTRFKLQPIDTGEVAGAIVEYATDEASGRVPPIGGPTVRTAGELAQTYRKVRGLRRPIVRVPVPGSVAKGFRAGSATCPDRTVGRVSWENWLVEQYDTGSPTRAANTQLES